MECKEEEDHLLEAAKALLLLGETPPPDENVLPLFFPQWGFHRRRSSCAEKMKRKTIDASCGHQSPDTPLDVVDAEAGSDPSTSGSDGGFHSSSGNPPPIKRFCSGHIKADEIERSPLVEAVRPSSQPIKRQAKKKTKSELQAEEIFLLEDKKRLMKILELEIMERDAVLAENRRLLSDLANLQRTPAKSEPTKIKFFVPDLNEPVLECLEPDCDDKLA